MDKPKTESEDDTPNVVLLARWIIEGSTEGKIPDFALPICARFTRGEITLEEAEKLLFKGLNDAK